jgi:hypothetical protein
MRAGVPTVAAKKKGRAIPRPVNAVAGPTPTGYAARLAHQKLLREADQQRRKKGPRYAASTVAFAGKKAKSSLPAAKVGGWAWVGWGGGAFLRAWAGNEQEAKSSLPAVEVGECGCDGELLTWQKRGTCFLRRLQLLAYFHL